MVSENSNYIFFAGGALATGALLHFKRSSLGQVAGLCAAAATTAAGIQAYREESDPDDPSQIRAAAFGAITVSVIGSGFVLWRTITRPFEPSFQTCLNAWIVPGLTTVCGALLLGKVLSDEDQGEVKRDLIEFAALSVSGAVNLALAHFSAQPTLTALPLPLLALFAKEGDHREEIDGPTAYYGQTAYYGRGAQCGVYLTSCLAALGLLACDILKRPPLSLPMLANNALRIGTCMGTGWLMQELMNKKRE